VRGSLIVLCLLAFATACGGEVGTLDVPAAPGPDGAATLTITTRSEAVELAVEVADEPGARRTGLMNRRELDPFDGMVFLWDEPVQASFWMKDTLIPLSIAFWNEAGRIVAILDMDPCEADPCVSYDPGTEFLGAVEVAQGVLAERGVRVGDLVELEPSAP
jgi:uncharacterized membrane protein (UPF0127 family)